MLVAAVFYMFSHAALFGGKHPVSNKCFHVNGLFSTVLPGGANILFKNELHLIQETKVQTACVINRQQFHLYYRLGKIIIERQELNVMSIVEKLSKDIQKEPGATKGFFSRNLWFMRRFYEEYNDAQFMKQLVSELDKSQSFEKDCSESPTSGNGI